MKLSRKSTIVLVLLMAVSTCFAQKWKNIVKGLGDRVGGKSNSQQATE
ncbi:MAG: hypothetical protein Q4P16_00680 [Spirochaetales bacterium]|nr:hypothetical protein [Spirochaetales bacterium]